MIDARKVYVRLRIALAVFALAAISHRAWADTVTPYLYNPATNAYNQCIVRKANLEGSGAAKVFTESCGAHTGNGSSICGFTAGSRGWLGWYNVRWRYTYQSDSASTCEAFGYSVSGCTSPEIPGPDGVCYDPNEACAAIKARQENPLDSLYLGPNDGNVYAGEPVSTCKGGCTLSPTPSMGKVAVNFPGQPVFSTRVQMRFTGTACTSTPESPPPAMPDPKPTEPVCAPAGAGQTFCHRQNGEQCYTASTSNVICWKPGETGTKTDGPIAQKREPGPVPITPPTAPPGETLSPVGTSTTVVNNTTVNTTTTTSTTTTTNYVTQNGTNAGDSESGESEDSDGESEDGEEGDSVSAGTCEINYTCTGGSAIECAALQETTKARCALESQDPTREMTGAESTALTGEGSATGSAEAEGAREDDEYGTGGLDADGMGWSNTCPTLDPVDVLGQTVTFNTSTFCEWMNAVGALVLLFAGLGALRILGGAI